MGASGWSYFVPYQDDIEKAFNELRWDVFRRGDYYVPEAVPSPDIFIPPEFIPDEETRRLLSMDTLPARTPDQLLEQCRYTGTHSIIDIAEIITDYEEDSSGPVLKSDLVDLFGTDKPDRAMVQEKEPDLQTYRGRWFCSYVIVYKDGKPDEIFFTGFSGD